MLQTTPNATGAVGFGPSPLRPGQPHTIFELAFAASPGTFGVQLHDPGPRFACDVLETEIVNFVGTAGTRGTTIETVDHTEFMRRGGITTTTTTTTTASTAAAEPPLAASDDAPAGASAEVLDTLEWRGHFARVVFAVPHGAHGHSLAAFRRALRPLAP